MCGCMSRHVQIPDLKKLVLTVNFPLFPRLVGLFYKSHILRSLAVDQGKASHPLVVLELRLSMQRTASTKETPEQMRKNLV